MKGKNLDYFMGLKYGVVMKKVGDDYCAFIPELSLFAEGKSASEAYEKLEMEKTAYFKRVLLIDAGDIVAEPLAVRIKHRFLEDLLLFGFKTLIAGIVFGIILSLFLPVLDVFVSTRISQVKSLMNMGNIIREVDNKLANMSEKDQEKIRTKIRRMAEKLKPMVSEIKVMFEDDSKLLDKSIIKNRKLGDSSAKEDGEKNH